MRVWQFYVPAVSLLLLLLAASGIGAAFGRWADDLHWRLYAARAPRPFPPEILVVAIDDATIREYGRLRYWSRARYAELVERLTPARAVVFDILFTEADAVDREGDRRFSEAIRRHGKVVLACFEWTEVQPFSAAQGERLAAATQRLPQVTPGIRDAAPPLPVTYERFEVPPVGLTAAAAGLGSVNLMADPDGVFRAPVLLKATSSGVAVPHVALAGALVAEGRRLEAVCDRDGLLLGDRRLLLVDGALELQPIARRPSLIGGGLGQPVPTIGFAEALRRPPGFFADRIVLVGETAAGTTDIRPNPLDCTLRGVELNAEILANLLCLDPVQRMPPGWSLALILVAVIAPFSMCRMTRAWRAALEVLAILLVELAVLELAFWELRYLPPWAYVVLGGLGGLLVMTLYRYVQEERAKREIRRHFSAYVSPKLVASIVNNPAVATQEGARRVVAILFSDIRGFTSYCERHSPEFVVVQLREYFEAMSWWIEETDGILDKYVGDAVMALWGPFLPEGRNPSAMAVTCALRMQEDLARLNVSWAKAGMPPFRIGIGIHTGEAVVGNVGSSRRMQYTALGDAVNLAARLESQTKELKAGILVSADCRQQAEAGLGDTVEFLPRGEVCVSGRTQPVTVFEVRWRTAVPVPAPGPGEATATDQPSVVAATTTVLPGR